MTKGLFFLAILSLASARPQNFEDVVGTASKDLAEVVASKTGALTLMGNSAINVTLDITNSAFDTLADIDFEGALNQTEDKVKANKVAMIEALFNAKRQIIRALGNATEAQAEFVADVYEAAVGQINQAVTATMGGIILSKSFMANITTNFPAVMEDLGESIEDSIDDAQDFVADSIDDAQDFVADAVEATSNATQEAASSLIYSMLSVKEQLHNMATNFSSQQAVNSGIFSIGLNLNATVTTAEGYASDFGIFDAMDDIVQMFGQIPKKINELLKAKYEFWISLISGQAEIDDIEENEENEDTEETTDAPIFDDDNNGEDTDARPRSSEFELNEEEGILRFLQGESRFWNQIREIIN